MQCLACGAEALIAQVVITKNIPLANRNGTLNMAGQKVMQDDIKNTWDDPKIRGPIICAECEQPHFYVVGAKRTLRKGDVHDARGIGWENIIAAEQQTQPAGSPD